MDTLKKHLLPVSGPEGLVELRKIAQRFEEKIFTAATNQVHSLQGLRSLHFHLWFTYANIYDMKDC